MQVLDTTRTPSSEEGHRTVSSVLPLSKPCISDTTLARHAAGASHSFTTLHIHCSRIYYGPLYRTDRPDEGKVWVAVYVDTCLTIRAILREAAPLLFAEQFLLTLRRFITRRWTPILSDNAPQFQVADQMLQSLWSTAITAINQTSVQLYMPDQRITW